jgi:hypothetical protein
VDVSEVLGADLAEAVALDDAGVVDQAVDVAVRLTQVGCEGGPVGFAGDVQAAAVAAVRLYVDGDDFGPALFQRLGFGGALASGGAGYDYDLAGQGLGGLVVAFEDLRHGGQHSFAG